MSEEDDSTLFRGRASGSSSTLRVTHWCVPFPPSIESCVSDNKEDRERLSLTLKEVVVRGLRGIDLCLRDVVGSTILEINRKGIRIL